MPPGSTAWFPGRAQLKQADTIAIGRLEVSCQAAEQELLAVSKGMFKVMEVEGQTLVCPADGILQPWEAQTPTAVVGQAAGTLSCSGGSWHCR